MIFKGVVIGLFLLAPFSLSAMQKKDPANYNFEEEAVPIKRLYWKQSKKGQSLWIEAELAQDCDLQIKVYKRFANSTVPVLELVPFVRYSGLKECVEMADENVQQMILEEEEKFFSTLAEIKVLGKFGWKKISIPEHTPESK